jgi:hypothetical protein
MPITLNHSNIGVQYSTGSSYIIETVKSDLYRRNEIADTIVSNNIQTAPVTPSIYIENSSGNVYAVESYTYTGTANTADYTRVFPKNTICDILIVAGGGGGGQQNAGGGGAGGLVLVQNFQANGTYTINVGKGGNGGISQSRGSNGNNTTFIKSDNSVIITANGGGGGGSTSLSGHGDGLLAANGGSGGGGGYYLANGTQTQKSQSQIGIISPATLNQFGEDGGHGGGGNASYPGGGGGGAGGVGATSASNTTGQNGGAGIDRVGTFIFSQKFLSSIGDNGWFAGGGGSGGDGASDGYGNGGSTLFGGGGNGDGIGRGINGISGTGGGGGGTRDPSAIVGNGGSGIVIIRYLLGTIPTNNLLTSEPTVISPAAMTESIQSFTHSGGTEAQTTHTITVGQNTICDILIVGGGGGGGNGDGSSNEPGGGGAGGIVYMVNKTLSSGTYKINVGKGGASNTNGNNSTITDNNNNTLIFDSISLIGKGGGKGATTASQTGSDGGSGGGGGHDRTNGGLATQGNTFWNGSSYVAGGYNGGKATVGGRGGGGGGAGELGDADGAGFGGDGVQVNITGVNTFYAGGGNAFPNRTTTRSDAGGGLVPETGNPVSGGNALPDTGSGGSGAYGGSGSGGAGGSGIVIIKFKSTTAIPEGNPITHKRLNFAFNKGIEDNIVAYYKFNDSSSLGLDSNPYNTKYNLTPTIVGGTGGYNTTIAIEGGSFQSTNDGDRLEGDFPFKSIYDSSTTGVSISLWFYKKLATYDNIYNTQLVNFIDPSNTLHAVSISLAHYNNNYKTNFSIQYGVSGEVYCSGISPTLAFETWYHLALIITKSGHIKLYMNGTNLNLVAGSVDGTIRTYNSTVYPIPTSSFPNTTKLRIHNAFGLGSFSGNVDEFYVFNKELSQQEVTSLYNKTYSAPPNTYTLNFPVPTIADINNNSNIVLRGAYDISLSTSNALIIPKSNQYIPKPTIFSTSNISVRYNLLNPTLDPSGAQWTYNTSNTNVYHMGSVGIGTKSPEYNLDVSGSLNAKTIIYNGLSIGMIAQVQHLTYTHMEVKNNTGWDAINEDLTSGFVIKITPKSSLSKMLVNLIVFIGMSTSADNAYWGIKLYRKIGIGSWTEITGCNGTETGSGAATAGTPVWISNNTGMVGYNEMITNASGTYLDSPNTTATVYYTAYWNQRIGDNPSVTGTMFLNRASTQNDAHRPAPSSSWTVEEIWYG